MRLGMVGLGRMGANMARRLMRGGHQVVVTDRSPVGGTAEEGYLYCGPSGAGHFVKMVHNGIEYGIMQAYAEGFDIVRNGGKSEPPRDQQYNLNLADIGGLAAGQRHQLLATGFNLDGLSGKFHACRIFRLCSGLGRRALGH